MDENMRLFLIFKEVNIKITYHKRLFVFITNFCKMLFKCDIKIEESLFGGLSLQEIIRLLASSILIFSVRLSALQFDMDKSFLIFCSK